MTRTVDAPSGHPLGHEIARGVFELYNALMQDISRLLTALDLTKSLADTLWQLDPRDGPVARGVLARRLHCDPSNVTFLVDRLEQRGLVARFDDPADRRVKAIGLTRTGAATRRRLISAIDTAPAFAPLTAGQRRRLAELLSLCAGDPTPPGVQHSDRR